MPELSSVHWVWLTMTSIWIVPFPLVKLPLMSWFGEFIFTGSI